MFLETFRDEPAADLIACSLLTSWITHIVQPLVNSVAPQRLPHQVLEIADNRQRASTASRAFLPLNHVAPVVPTYVTDDVAKGVARIARRDGSSADGKLSMIPHGYISSTDPVAFVVPILSGRRICKGSYKG